MLARHTGCETRVSPDHNSVFWLQVHLTSLFDTKCVVEDVKVLDHLVATELCWRVWVSSKSLNHDLVTAQSSPALRPCHQEALLGCVAIDYLWLTISKPEQVCLPGNTQSTKVTNVLTDGELTVDLVLVIKLCWGELVVLFDQRASSGLKSFSVSLGPP